MLCCAVASLLPPASVSISAPALQRDPPRVVDSRTAKLLAPVLAHVTNVLYPGHPNLSSISLPAARATTTTTTASWSTTATATAGASSPSRGGSPRGSVVGTPATPSTLSSSLLSPESPLARPASSLGNGASPREKERKQKRKKKDRAAAAATATSDDDD